MRKIITVSAIAVALFAGFVAIGGCAMTSKIPEFNQSSQYGKGVFHNNPKPEQKMDSSFGKVLWRFITEEKSDAEPSEPIPLQQVNLTEVANTPTDKTLVYRLGHSSLLIKIAGKLVLVDPMFSERASPFSFMGPKRFHPVPLNVDELDNIDVIVISHDHYDHLDKQTITKLHSKTKQLLVPLGVSARLTDWGVPQNKITELDWWQNNIIDELSFTATPAQHFSGRGLNDRNKTLWASWVIQSSQHKIFFSGDTGYFPGFKAIGEKFDGFDLAILENGAYDANWPGVHMMPTGTIQAFKDLNAKVLMPVHNSTFDLAFHAWCHPLQQMVMLAQQEGIELATPVIGEPYAVNAKNDSQPWWELL